MDAYIDKHLERVERALVTLTESIAKYKPQPAHGQELAAADRALAAALLQLQAHQTNDRTLAALHAQSAALDAQIRDTLRLLWTTRRDISATTVTTFPDEAATPRYDVNWEELLGYARRISKKTMPAPSILAAAAAVHNETDLLSAPSTGDAVNTPNPTSTPAPGATPLPSIQANDNNNNTSAENQPPPQPQGRPMDLPAEWDRFLDPLTGVTFVPWPPESEIRTGALASIESIARQGIDPRGYDPAQEDARRAREEEERRAREEQEAREREDKVRLAREEQARMARERQRERERAMEEAMRRGSVVGAAAGSEYGGGGISPTLPREGAKQQFQFMQDDDDDDD